MSLEYTLELASEARLSGLAERLSRVSGYRQTGAGVVAPGIHVDFGIPGPLEAETITDEFGFQPRASITFRLDKHMEPVKLRVRLLRGCMALLSESTGDAVLLFNGETVIFLRRGGTLVLNRVEGFWTPEALAAVPAPHAFESIRSI